MSDKQTIDSVRALTDLGRVRLSEHFFMREMLYSEVANFHGLPNIPDKPNLVVEAGRQLCERLLEPLQAAFGRIVVRSAYRSPTVNAFCHERLLAGQQAYYCGDNDHGAARHIWDLRDKDGFLGATATVLVPWYLEKYEASGDFEPLAWWIRDHIPGYAEVVFMPWQCTFNIRWYEGPSERAIYRDTGETDVLLTKEGMETFDGDHASAYPGFPDKRGQGAGRSG